MKHVSAPAVRPLAVWSWVMASLLALPLLAHEQKEAVTRVFFNERTGSIEVMHRFLLHDAEHASRKLFGADMDLLGRAEDRGRFEAYVHAHFELLDQKREPIPLDAVGNEIEGRFLWVYAEAPIPENALELTVSHGALRDVWADQINLVNIERAAQVRSAVFSEGSDAITLIFEDAEL